MNNCLPLIALILGCTEVYFRYVGSALDKGDMAKEEDHNSLYLSNFIMNNVKLVSVYYLFDTTITMCI